MRPKLTIITPSFNQAAFIEKTIRSVLDQGYENLEYIVVDGGSTDGSVQIIQRYEDQLAWWISESDDGQTDALNKGLRRASGEIIAYINSDDYYVDGAFDAAVDALERSDAVWAVGRCRYQGGGEDLVWAPELPGRNRHWWLLLPWGVPQAATFWRREAFDRHGLFRTDMHYVFDTEFELRLAFAGELPKLIDRELAVRVVHEDAKSWDLRPFMREQDKFIGLFSHQLEWHERARLQLARALKRVGFYALTRATSSVWRRAGLPPLRS